MQASEVENVLYRLDLGMGSLLEPRCVKLWVVMVGTNNLKKAPRPVEVARYRLLLQALLRVAPRSQILACGLFRRKAVSEEYVVGSNELLMGLVEDMRTHLGGVVHWLEAPKGVDEGLLVDHVHLNEEGYRTWDEALYRRIRRLLEPVLTLD